MKKFGIENFRVFKDFQEIEIKPITFLVGPNNSGKSSIFKALKFAGPIQKRDFIPSMDFRIGSNYKQDFFSLCNNPSLPIKLKVDFLLDDVSPLQVCYQYKSFGIESFFLKHQDNTILSMQFEEKQFEHRNSIQLINVGIDLCGLIKLFKDNLKLQIKQIDDSIEIQKNKIKKSTGIHRSFLAIELTNLDTKRKEKINLVNLTQLLLLEVNLEDELMSLTEIQYNKFKRLLQKEIEFRDFSSIDEVEKVEIARIFEKLCNDPDNYFEFEMEKIVSIWISLIEQIVHSKVNAEIGNCHISLTPLASYIMKDLSKRISNGVSVSVNELNGIDKIPSIKSKNQKYFMLNEDSSDYFTQVIKNIFKHYNSSNQYGILYINSWLIKFEIGIEIIPKYINNDIGEVYIMGVDMKEINLMDLGFGVSQILSLISIPLEYFEHYEDYIDPNGEILGKDQITEGRTIPFIFLEEPESNLHPKWHSILVDLIVELNRNFGIQFIIETHSEYMIRKMQYLVAEKNNGLSKDDAIIYYLNNDKNVNIEEGENKIKRIEFDQFGGLTDSFGPGFFDESSNLKFDLLKLNRHQSN